MCCNLIPIRRSDNLLVRDGLQNPDKEFYENLIPITRDSARKINEEYVNMVQNLFPHVKFCSCKYFNEKTGCTLNKKPFVCKNFPSTPLALVPDECVYRGKIFMDNEELKCKIRKIKEEILDYESLIETGDKEASSYKRIIDNLKRFIVKYKDFGSEDW